MSTSDELKKEIQALLTEHGDLLNLARDSKDTLEFGAAYQRWYSRAYKVVEALAPERLGEFSSYYLIDPKRKVTDAGNYVIQDYIKGIGARTDRYNKPLWDINNLVMIRVMNVAIIANANTASMSSTF